MLEKMQKISAS